jgi:hypothetical protein
MVALGEEEEENVEGTEEVETEGEDMIETGAKEGEEEEEVDLLAANNSAIETPARADSISLRIKIR